MASLKYGVEFKKSLGWQAGSSFSVLGRKISKCSLSGKNYNKMIENDHHLGIVFDFDNNFQILTTVVLNRCNESAKQYLGNYVNIPPVS